MKTLARRTTTKTRKKKETYFEIYISESTKLCKILHMLKKIYFQLDFVNMQQECILRFKNLKLMFIELKGDIIYKFVVEVFLYSVTWLLKY